MTIGRIAVTLWSISVLALPAFAQAPVEKAFAYLDAAVDRGAERIFVYDDADSGLHHFYPSDWLNAPWHAGDPMNITVDTACHQTPHSGSTCMHIHWNGKPGHWGPWNGIIFTTRATWFGNFGPPLDLSSASRLTGWVRTDTPGISVKLFVGGGRNPFKQVYPRQGEWTRLNTTEWTRFEMDLSHVPKSRLAAVRDGLGIVFDAAHAGGEKPLDLYFDEISYDVARPDIPRFPASYGARPSANGAFPLGEKLFREGEGVSRNVAYQYDMALVVLSYLARGAQEDIRHARLIADGLLYCSENDRFFDDGGLYNGMMAGDARQWTGFPARRGKDLSGRVAGWWDPNANQCKGGWLEDYRHVSTSVGDTAWTIIALAALFDKTGDDRYRKAAVRFGQWVRDFCRRPGDASPGFTGGTEGWPRKDVKDPDKTGLDPVKKRMKFQTAAEYRSTEMNLDLAVAMYHLARITGDKSWEADCASARQFVLGKFSQAGQSRIRHFLAGEAPDPKNPGGKWVANENPDQLPLDTNSWSVLALGRTPETEEGIRWAEDQCRVDKGAGGFSGFSFSPADTTGVWTEGTGQMTVAYWLLGAQDKAEQYLKELERIQAASPDGGAVAATRDGLFTGFYVHIASEDQSKGEDKSESAKWRYFSQNHLAALAWLIFAELKWNPYYQIPAATPPPPLYGMESAKVKDNHQP